MKKKLYCPFTDGGIIDRCINKYSIHIYLQHLRVSKGYTQEEFSTISGLSVSTISKLETGGNVFLSSVIQYAHALGYEVQLEKKGKSYGYAR